MEKIKQNLSTTFNNIHQMMKKINETLLEIEGNLIENHNNDMEPVRSSLLSPRSIIVEASNIPDAAQPATAFFVQRNRSFNAAGSFIPYTKMTTNSNKLYSFDLKLGIFRPKIPGIYYVYFSGHS